MPARPSSSRRRLPTGLALRLALRLAPCLARCLARCLALALVTVPAGTVVAQARALQTPAGSPAAADARAAAGAPDDEVLGRSGDARAPLSAGSVQRANALLDADVLAEDGAPVGRVENLALDAGHDLALFALVGAGKWVAREDRLYPLPLEALSPRPADPAGGGPKLRLQQVGRALLAMVPQAERGSWPGDDGPMDAALWAAAVWRHYGMTPYWNTNVPVEPPALVDREGRPLDPPPPAPPPFRKNGSDLVLLRLRTILGADVVSASSDDRLGRLVDVLVDLSKSQLVAGIVARDDGDGKETLLPVPWTALETRAAGTRFALPLEVPAWRAATGFAPDAWPSLRETDWARLGRATLAAVPAKGP